MEFLYSSDLQETFLKMALNGLVKKTFQTLFTKALLHAY